MVQNFRQVEVPPIPGETRDQGCLPDCKENFCGSRQIRSDTNPIPFSDTNLDCSDLNCRHLDFGINSSHVACGTGCTDFVYTPQHKLDPLGLSHSHGKKCRGHKHVHSHHKGPPSLVHSPDEVPECLTKKSSNELAEQAKLSKTQSTNKSPEVKQKPIYCLEPAQY